MPRGKNFSALPSSEPSATTRPSTNSPEPQAGQAFAFWCVVLIFGDAGCRLSALLLACLQHGRHALVNEVDRLQRTQHDLELNDAP